VATVKVRYFNTTARIDYMDLESRQNLDRPQSACKKRRHKSRFLALEEVSRYCNKGL